MRLWLVARILLHPVRALGDRIDQWVMARVKRQPGPIVIGRRRIYILPTRFGYGFGFMSLIMLLGAMNYSNSMAFALAFLLAGLGLVCMHHTHGNLMHLSLRSGKTQPVFAGETAHFEIQVENPASAPRYSLTLSWPKYSVKDVTINDDGKPDKGRRQRADETSSDVTTDVLPGQTTPMKLALPAQQRGWLRARVFSLSTEFPLGLFHAWTWAELDQICLVYPRPAPPGNPPPPSAGMNGMTASSRSGQDEFAGLRSYQRGDSLKSIHWKSLPKLQTPMVKQFAETLEHELWLDWNGLPHLDTEARLSQLTRWVLDAEGSHRSYGLRIPGLVLEPARGDTHQHQCLKVLALFQTP